ncbi:TetR/AcrR family transcriptional regulator [Bittarella massiliensis (ex Durand et al. 2017)]|uniref:TetR family transcriptional regulator n=1 Tax=Bittarella massiliensis (ex Durand et al. 2017) TaxID=1720313 RepID=A0ABW9WYC9_9FIRM|nr:TetR/AcrR family transcriptional regulator [Bittarella massiliensis (ex Durand et al. 2017)]MZL70057.1 TetR family transcriptional regulator [Bittarella massiliensis (ex Durand et al. 2017)]MZL81239.1 TetR family transcriptional regulator [Bittarella massiliensis (ex Durand et al. 2017)]
MNIVHVGGGAVHPAVTSREAILAVSRESIMKKGWTALNIRSVAAACGISVGSVYNYFGSKSGLVAATVESIWGDIFRLPEQGEGFEDFLSCIRWIYGRIGWGNQTYPGFFALHAMRFWGEDKAEAKRLMARTWQHMQERLKAVLEGDRQVRPDAFDETFTRDQFVELVFSMILAALLRESDGQAAALEVIRRAIY